MQVATSSACSGTSLNQTQMVSMHENQLEKLKVSEYFQRQKKLTAVLTPAAPPCCLKGLKRNQVINLKAEKGMNTLDQETHLGRLDYTVIYS